MHCDIEKALQREGDQVWVGEKTKEELSGSAVNGKLSGSFIKFILPHLKGQCSDGQPSTTSVNPPMDRENFVGLINEEYFEDSSSDDGGVEVFMDEVTKEELKQLQRDIATTT